MSGRSLSCCYDRTGSCPDSVGDNEADTNDTNGKSTPIPSLTEHVACARTLSAAPALDYVEVFTVDLVHHT